MANVAHAHDRSHADIISTNDLFQFHQAHFAPSNVCNFSEHFTSDSETAFTTANSALEAELYPLGFYDDGQQRTLTDEQIAIFRHSEIQSLLREQRLRDEQRETEIPIFSSAKSNVSKNGDGEDDEDDMIEYEEFLRREQEDFRKARRDYDSTANQESQIDPLNYGEVSPQVQLAPVPAPTERRLVSYADMDNDMSGQHQPLSTKAPRPFLWPLIKD
ncbi:MAG: hypothetical protein M1814_000151 [Vezdaea aestivalis]|nr:MAG: hypothetical protein M1814_000151 [Vezdaea aestivalis]